MAVAGDAAARLPALLRPLAADPRRAALFLDFDGTLAAIVADPTGARPLPGVPALLSELATMFALVAVVSGRPTGFLAEVLGEPEGVTLAHSAAKAAAASSAGTAAPSATPGRRSSTRSCARREPRHPKVCTSSRRA